MIYIIVAIELFHFYKQHSSVLVLVKEKGEIDMFQLRCIFLLSLKEAYGMKFLIFGFK